VALAGPPGAGKSTFSERLIEELDAAAPGTAVLVPMDGYHLDNAVLSTRGLLARKGAPETFDAAGFVADLGRIRAGEEVAVPIFDRVLDRARTAGRVVEASHRLVLVEGNYLLLDLPPWTLLENMFDRTVFLFVPEPELRRRLIDRWLQHGLDSVAAIAKAEGNDLANARLVLQYSREADVRLGTPHLGQGRRGGCPNH
jgi:pantothenate kinase